MEATATMGDVAQPASELGERFSALVARERQRTVALAYHLTGGNLELAKDVAQEAFFRAFRALPRFRGEAELRTWLVRIVIRQAATSLRRQARQRHLGVAWPWASEDPPAAAHASGEPSSVVELGGVRVRISAALLRLSTSQRAAFSLVHLEGVSIEEAARMLGRSPGTVKSHLHRALRALRSELGDLREGRGGES